MSGKKTTLKNSRTIFTLGMISLLFLLLFMTLGQTLMVVPPSLLSLSLSPVSPLIYTLLSLESFRDFLLFQIANLFFNLLMFDLYCSTGEILYTFTILTTRCSTSLEWLHGLLHITYCILIQLVVDMPKCST